MDNPAGNHYRAVPLEKKRGGETAVLAFHLRIRESQPYLGNLACGEKGGEELDSRTEKSHVRERVDSSIFRPFPKTGALDINTDVIILGMPLGKSDGIFPLPAAELDNDRMAISEHLLSPSAFDGMVLKKQLTILTMEHYLLRIRLQQAAESLVLCKFP